MKRFWVTLFIMLAATGPLWLQLYRCRNYPIGNGTWEESPDGSLRAGVYLMTDRNLRGQLRNYVQLELSNNPENESDLVLIETHQIELKPEQSKINLGDVQNRIQWPTNEVSAIFYVFGSSIKLIADPADP